MNPPLIRESTRPRFYTCTGLPRDSRVPNRKAGGADEHHAGRSGVGRWIALRPDHRPEGRPADQHTEVEERGEERECGTALRIARPLHHKAGEDREREAMAEAAKDACDC